VKRFGIWTLRAAVLLYVLMLSAMAMRTSAVIVLFFLGNVTLLVGFLSLIAAKIRERVVQ